MFNKFISLILLTTICSAFAWAKNNNQVVGKVIEKSSGNVLSFATIVIQSKDKKVLGGATSGNDGTFILSNVLDGECTVKVSFIGYKDTTLILNFKEGENKKNLGEIALVSDSRSLSAAIVTAKVPVIEQKLDKIVMNVAEAVTTQGNNALDVLRKAPGISIDPSGNILLNGQAVQLWIDNRPSNLSGADLESLLSGTDGASIDKIEIISQPSAKYDASGSGGIINIKTKKIFLQGINGSLRAAYDGGYYDKYYQGANGTLNMNYRASKTNTFVTYSPRYNQDFHSFYSETGYGNKILKASTISDFSSSSHSFKIGTDYFANKKNVFGVIFNGLLRDADDHSNEGTGGDLYHNNIIIESTKTKQGDNRSFDNLSANINYTHTFTEGNELTLNADYGYYDLMNDSYQQNNFYNSSGIEILSPKKFNSNSQQFINIFSFKSDYERIIFKKIKLEAGFKWAQSRTNNDLLREDWKNTEWLKNDTLSSKFNYNEQISAAYFSLAKQFNKQWTAKAGLRAEYTSVKGEWISADTITTKGYMNLFPTIFIGYTPSANFRYSLSYTLRIERPSYYQLNPFRQYVDAKSSVEGNPNLDPQFSHQFSLSVGYKSFLTLALVYQRAEGAIIQNPYFNAVSGEKMLKWENFGKQVFAGASLAVTELPIKKWFVINWNSFVASFTNTSNSYKSSNVFANSNLNLAFILPKNYRVELNSFIQTGIPYGYFKVKSTGDLSLAIKKGILDNKATISLNINDILKSRKNNASTSNSQISSYFFESYNKSQFVSLSFNYRFGKGKAFKQRNVGVQDEASRVGNQ